MGLGSLQGREDIVLSPVCSMTPRAALDEGGESVMASAARGSRDREPRPGNRRKRMAELTMKGKESCSLASL